MYKRWYKPGKQSMAFQRKYASKLSVWKAIEMSGKLPLKLFT